jgi:hypothetical protein
MSKSSLFKKESHDSRGRNGQGIATSSLVLDELFIAKMKADPHRWNAFLQKGRCLYALSKTLFDIQTS